MAAVLAILKSSLNMTISYTDDFGAEILENRGREGGREGGHANEIGELINQLAVGYVSWGIKSGISMIRGMKGGKKRGAYSATSAAVPSNKKSRVKFSCMGAHLLNMLG
jgi:hypothetical protein